MHLAVEALVRLRQLSKDVIHEAHPCDGVCGVSECPLHDVRDVSGKDLRLVGLVDGAEGSFDLLECAQLPRESLGNQRLIDSFVHETPPLAVNPCSLP